MSAVSGAVGQPGVFYAGFPSGGVWKTTSAGETWYPVFDSIKSVSSIGAVEVAPSDPNTVYVGTGDMVTGGAISNEAGMILGLSIVLAYTMFGGMWSVALLIAENMAW